MNTYSATHEGQTATFITRREVSIAVFAKQTDAAGNSEPWVAVHWAKNIRSARRQYDDIRHIPGGGIVHFAFAKAQGTN